MQDSEHLSCGTLYLVSTPIGNLKDISFRAVETLADVDLIAAEDTRRTRILLNHYDIATPTTSYFDFNKAKKIPYLLQKLKGGACVGLVSDAGTPGISDPAFRLVAECIANGIRIEAIPGATAFVPALILSGLPCDRFVFEGFLPRKKGRKSRIAALESEYRTIIFYESPYRLLRTLRDLEPVFSTRRAVIVRELTKIYEQIYRGLLSELIANFSTVTLKGEFVLVIEGNDPNGGK